jgi:hypothetical protein
MGTGLNWMSCAVEGASSRCILHEVLSTAGGIRQMHSTVIEQLERSPDRVLLSTAGRSSKGNDGVEESVR